jgi:hypothetical protein
MVPLIKIYIPHRLHFSGEALAKDPPFPRLADTSHDPKGNRDMRKVLPTGVGRQSAFSMGFGFLLIHREALPV